MKEITITFTPEELRELAKQLNLASNFFIPYDYENQAMVDDIMNRVCGTGLHEAPETGGFRLGGPFSTIFIVSQEVDEECEPLVQLFMDYSVEEYLPYKLAERDFIEQYGKLEPEEIVRNPELSSALEAIQKVYIEEFETYGITHLRLIK